ncbi:hypothetical protein KR084_008361, partial [Drosophila pseudotakahashii]
GIPGTINITTAPFVKIGSHYYFIEDKTQKNWYAAYKSCRQMEADLIAFKNKEEFNVMQNYIVQTNWGKKFWTVGTDLLNQGDHIWLANGESVPSDIWSPGEPNNNNNNEHCDNMIAKANAGLNDDVCSKAHYFICQAPQPKTASFIVW